MKNIIGHYERKSKHLSIGIVLGIIALGGIGVGVLMGIDNQNDGYRVNQGVPEGVVAHNECQYVTSSIGDVFIPTRAVGEWTTFKANKPASISMVTCTEIAHCPSAGHIFNASTTRPGCGYPDRIVCTGTSQGYAWAMCNQGTTVLGGEGVLFQWGRNNAWWNPSGGDPATLAGPTSLATANANVARFITTADNTEWLNTYDSNRLGGGGTTYNAGTFFDRSAGNQGLMVGPCNAGYHVPTIKEWCDTMSVLGAPYCDASPVWYEAGGEYYANTNIRNLLVLTLGGVRANNTSTLWGDGTNSVYWTSSPYGANHAYAISILPAQIGYGYDDRGDGFSVRCVRNN